MVAGAFITITPPIPMPVNLRIYIVRHGETEWNRIHKIQGHLDVPLNQTGLKQAMLVAEALKDIPFVRAFSSDLQRASKVMILKLLDLQVVLTNLFPDRRMRSPIPSGYRFGNRRIDQGTCKQSSNCPYLSSSSLLYLLRGSIWGNCRGRSAHQTNQHHHWRQRPTLLRGV